MDRSRGACGRPASARSTGETPDLMWPALGDNAQAAIGQPTTAHRATPVVQSGQVATAGSRGRCTTLARGTPGTPEACPDAFRRRHARTKRYAMTAIASTMTIVSVRDVSPSASSVLHVPRASRGERGEPGGVPRETCTTLRHDRHRVAVVAWVSKVVSHRGQAIAVMDRVSLDGRAERWSSRPGVRATTGRPGVA